MATDWLRKAGDFTGTMSLLNRTQRNRTVVCYKNAIAPADGWDRQSAIGVALPDTFALDNFERARLQVLFDGREYTFEFRNLTLEYRRAGGGRHRATCTLADR